MKIDKKLTLEFNSFPMRLHIWSEDPANPILLFVHGGPGNPFRHKIKNYMLPLTDCYTVVAYDERGAGGSYLPSIKPSSLTVDGYVDDLIALTKYLKNEYTGCLVYLVCESFGSVIGSYAIQKEPALFAAYLSYGQIVNDAKAMAIQYKLTWKAAKQADDKEAMQILKKIGHPKNGEFANPRNAKEFFPLFYSLVFDPGKEPYEDREIKPFLSSNEYTKEEKKNLKKGMALSSRASRHFPAFNLEGSTFPIPYYVFHGKKDIITPAALVPEYMQGITAPKKELMMFKDCGHLVAFEKPTTFIKEVRRRLK